MAKDKQGKKKEKKSKKKTKKHSEPVWSEAIALQSLVRRVEQEVLDRYMTVPNRLDKIRGLLMNVLDLLQEDPLSGCGGGRPCPSGYYCCDGVCRPYPCEVGPNPNPKPPKIDLGVDPI